MDLKKLYSELEEAVNDGSPFLTCNAAKATLQDAMKIIQGAQELVVAFKKVDGHRE